MSKKVDYFLQFDIVGSEPQYDLFELDARLVPFMLRTIEGVKGRSFWANDAEYIEAYDRLSELQARLLMPFGERYIREVRALRNGPATPLADQDAELDPFTLQLTSLRDIQLGVASADDTALAALQRLEQLQIAANQGDAESQAELLRIGAIIAGAL